MTERGAIINSAMARAMTTPEKQGLAVVGNGLVAAAATGALVGFFGWLLTLGVYNWVLSPIFCRSADTAAVCAASDLTAWILAYGILSSVGLFMLIRANVFRPLLVVLAALVSLWAIGLWFFPLVWWVGLLWQTGLFAVAYALYAWLASVQKFIIALVTIVIVVVVMRLLFIY